MTLKEEFIVYLSHSLIINRELVILTVKPFANCKSLIQLIRPNDDQNAVDNQRDNNVKHHPRYNEVCSILNDSSKETETNKQVNRCDYCSYCELQNCTRRELRR